MKDHSLRVERHACRAVTVLGTLGEQLNGTGEKMAPKARDQERRTVIVRSAVTPLTVTRSTAVPARSAVSVPVAGSYETT